MQTSLERIADKARREPKYRFRSLYRMINEELLLDSWSKLNRNAAAGIDKISYQEYNKEKDANIQRLVEVLKEKRYKARLVRRQYIPKGNGKTRPLGIPVMEDKMVQYAAMQILQAIYEQDFLPCSYGYRPNRGALDAVKELRTELEKGPYHFIVEADIKGFFDNIDHEWMIKMLEERVHDEGFIRLIKKWLKAGILDTDGKVLHPITGTPQGGIISPLLANIYLHYVLNLWFEKVIKKKCKGEAYLCVYADDFVCAFERQDDATEFYQELGERLGKFGLTLSPEKTNIIEFRKSRNAFDFLGFEFRLAKTRKRMIRIRTSRKKLQGSKKNVKEWCKKARNMPINELFRVLNMKLKGYFNYYGIWGNYRSLSVFYEALLQTLYKWLNRRSQKRSYTWEGFLQMIRELGLVKPRIVHGRPRVSPC